MAGRVVTCENGQTVTYSKQCYPTYSVSSFNDISLYYVNQIETSAISNYNSLQGTLKLQNWRFTLRSIREVAEGCPFDLRERSWL